MPNGKRRIFNVLRPTSIITQTIQRNSIVLSNSLTNITNNKNTNEGINIIENKSTENKENLEEIIKPIPVCLHPKENLVKSVMDKINNSYNLSQLKINEEEKCLSEKKENIQNLSPKKESVVIENIFDDQEFFKIPYSLTREWVIKNFNLKK